MSRKISPTTVPVAMSSLFSMTLVDSEERPPEGAEYDWSSEVVGGDGAGREAPIAPRMNRVMMLVSFIVIIVIGYVLLLNSVSLEYNLLRNVLC
jgi:hypothetical protein